MPKATPSPKSSGKARSKSQASSPQKTTPRKAAAATAERRSSIRFLPEPGTLAELRFVMKDGHPTSLQGLVLNESRTGFSVVVMTDRHLREGVTCLCRVGSLPETKAIIRWVRILDAQLLKVGLEYDFDK